jgi:CheY-like chemotaxis protein
MDRWPDTRLSKQHPDWIAEMTDFQGLRVFVVEDEALLSMAMQDMLADLDCEVVGTAARLETALELAQSLAFDLAVLDVNLGGQRVDPVADIIAARGLPVVFVTGYGKNGAPRHVAGPVLEKPYELVNLKKAFSAALAGRHD